MPAQPKSLLYLTLILVGVAVSYPLQIMFLYGHGWNEMQSVVAKMAPLNWVVSAGCLVCAVLVYRASSSAWKVFPFLAVVVAWNNVLSSSLGNDYGIFTTSLATFGFVLTGSLFLMPQARDLWAHPEKRWWLQPARKKINAKIFVVPEHGERFRAETFDISPTGAFIQMPEFSGTPLIRKGETISVRLAMGELSILRCDARVIRTSQAKGLYPDGLGVQFVNLNRSTTRKIQKYLNSP